MYGKLCLWVLLIEGARGTVLLFNFFSRVCCVRPLVENDKVVHDW
jgi:hypothetical protein